MPVILVRTRELALHAGYVYHVLIQALEGKG